VALAFVVTACGGGGGDDDSTPTIDPPDAPTSFTVERTPDATLSATLTWSAAATGTEATSFEVYRSTTAGTVFQPDNHLISIPAVAGQTLYTFVDNAGLTPVDTYWVVSAKNAGGETPTAEVMYKPIGPPGGTGDTGYGNNFSAALIFADGVGLGGDAITGTWTSDLTAIDYATGLRPLSTEVLPPTQTTLPYFDPDTEFLLDGTSYFEQQTASTRQGEWVDGSGEQPHVTATWGDNLISQSLTEESVIRIEMVLSKALSTPMQSYSMKSLYGAKNNEIQGTDGTTYDNSTAFVFASNAHLKIEKLDDTGTTVVGAPLYDQTLWEGDGPGFLGGEVNVAGNFTYGFVWDLKSQVLPLDIPSKTGTWRITFSLDPQSPQGNFNNTFIDTAANGVRVSDTEVYIDINIAAK